MNLQQAFAQLIESGLLSERTFRNRTQLFITEEGLDALRFFENRISQEIKKDIDSYLQEKSMSLKKEISITSDYRRQGQQNYKAHLAAWENGAPLIDLTFSVPSEDIASAICINWEEKNEEIYQYLVTQLF
jgi:hypothetical protein